MQANHTARELEKYGYTVQCMPRGIMRITNPVTGLVKFMGKIEALETVHKLQKRVLL